MHEADLTDQTKGVEQIIRGLDDVQLLPGNDDIIVIPTPGHTKGSMSFLARTAGSHEDPEAAVLFTGDHLSKDEIHHKLNGWFDYNWYSVQEQRKSILKLKNYSFDYILPGHGRRIKFSSKQERIRMIEDAATV